MKDLGKAEKQEVGPINRSKLEARGLDFTVNYASD